MTSPDLDDLRRTLRAHADDAVGPVDRGLATRAAAVHARARRTRRRRTAAAGVTALLVVGGAVLTGATLRPDGLPPASPAALPEVAVPPSVEVDGVTFVLVSVTPLEPGTISVVRSGVRPGDPGAPPPLRALVVSGLDAGAVTLTENQRPVARAWSDGVTAPVATFDIETFRAVSSEDPEVRIAVATYRAEVPATSTDTEAATTRRSVGGASLAAAVSGTDPQEATEVAAPSTGDYLIIPTCSLDDGSRAVVSIGGRVLEDEACGLDRVPPVGSSDLEAHRLGRGETVRLEVEAPGRGAARGEFGITLYRVDATRETTVGPVPERVLLRGRPWVLAQVLEADALTAGARITTPATDDGDRYLVPFTPDARLDGARGSMLELIPDRSRVGDRAAIASAENVGSLALSGTTYDLNLEAAAPTVVLVYRPA